MRSRPLLVRRRARRARSRACALVAHVALAASCASEQHGASSSSDGGQGGATRTGSATSGTAGGGGVEEHPPCPEKDPSADFSFSFDLAAWDPATAGGEYSLELEAPCVVAEVERAVPGSVSVALECDATDRPSVPIHATVRLPVEAPLALRAGGAVTLAYGGHGFQGERQPAAWFAIRSELGLLAAGYDVDYPDLLPAWSAAMGPSAEVDAASPCPKECLELPPGRECTDDWGTYSRRLTIRLSEGDAAITLLDGARGRVALPEGEAEVIVGAATTQVSTSGQDDLRVLVLRTDEV